MVSLGLEWLWRLITQPARVGRMWNAIPVFSYIILKHKLKQ
jgi:UDP-N-acetyl-D-mannosaminuronic acid transferase (WecB/TagA/CpsF family)